MKSTHQVNDDILVESGPPLGCHLAHVGHGLWVICVDVEDGGIDHSGHVSAVGGGPRHAGVSGEANLSHIQDRNETGHSDKTVTLMGKMVTIT